MGARRQTGKQTNGQADKQGFRYGYSGSSPRAEYPSLFPLRPSSLVCTVLRLFVGACFVSGWALRFSPDFWERLVVIPERRPSEVPVRCALRVR